MKPICVIPARGGSKRIPRKNVRDFCGKPMIAWSIEAAFRSDIFSRIVVSTDDEEIADISRKWGADVPFFRPAELSDDYAGTDAVFLHALTAMDVECEHACCLYATAPFVRSEDLRRGYEELLREKASSAFAVTTFEYPVLRALRLTNSKRLKLMWPEYKESRSQDLPEAWHDAGQFYWVHVERYLKEKSIMSNNAVPVPVPRFRVQDIDTEEDWTKAEYMFRMLHDSMG